MNKNYRKLDLFQDCYNPGMGASPKEFSAIFCKRCRNSDCVNSGWSESRWTDRILTQEERLLRNPVFGDPKDPSFREVSSQVFREVGEPLVISNRDPWEPRSAHLAEPPREISGSSAVEQALSALRGVREPSPAAPPSPELPLPSFEAAPPAPAPVARVPSFETRAREPEPRKSEPRPEPAHFKASPPAMNTPFPEEGVMLDGSPPPQGPASEGGGGGDPWAPKPNAVRKVAVGAKVKMG